MILNNQRNASIPFAQAQLRHRSIFFISILNFIHTCLEISSPYMHVCKVSVVMLDLSLCTTTCRDNSVCRVSHSHSCCFMTSCYARWPANRCNLYYIFYSTWVLPIRNAWISISFCQLVGALIARIEVNLAGIGWPARRLRSVSLI